MPFTSHGHLIPRMPRRSLDSPKNVNNCGGPPTCLACNKETVELLKDVCLDTSPSLKPLKCFYHHNHNGTHSWQFALDPEKDQEMVATATDVREDEHGVSFNINHKRYQDHKRYRESMAKPVVDMVNHPPHYTSHPSGIECIEITRHMNFNVGNAVKYLWREGLKDQSADIEDLEKAAWYLNDEIKRRKNELNHE
jgi:hypothetical protein